MEFGLPIQRMLSYRERKEVRFARPPVLLRLLIASCSTLEGSTSQVSEQGLRKTLYQKIVAAFPEGWMSSGQVSREGERNVVVVCCERQLNTRLVSVMKKKFEKEAMESES